MSDDIKNLKTPALSRLPDKQRKFLLNYALHGFKDQAKAYKDAGYKGKNIDSLASQLMKNPKVIAALQEIKDYQNSTALKDAEDVRREMEAVAFAKSSDFLEVDKNGNIKMKPLDQIPPQAMAALEIKDIDSKGAVSLKQVSKQRALQDLARVHGLMRDDAVPVSVELNIING